MKFKYLIFILALSVGLTGCPKKTATNVPPPPPVTAPVPPVVQPPVVPPVVEPPIAVVPQPVVEPSTPVVYSINNIQTIVAKTCGTCGDTGGPGNTASAVYNQTLNVSDAPLPNDGKASLFDIAGKVPYANAYWYWPHTALTEPKLEFTYDFDLYIPTASLAASQAIEWEMQVSANNVTYNFAYQLEWRSKLIKTFDYTKRAWVATTYSTADFTPDKWHHVIMRNSLNEVAKTGTLKTLTVDYDVKDISVTRTGTPKVGSSHFTNAFQLDSNGKTPPTPYKVFVDKMRITWYAVN